MADNEQFGEGLLKLVNRINSFYLPGSSKNKCFKFIVDDKEVGYVLPHIAELFREYYEIFKFENKKCHFILKTERNTQKALFVMILNPVLKTAEERTLSMESFLLKYREKNVLKKLNKWRDEHYSVKATFSEAPLLSMDRSATSLFGIRQFGCHVNGYTKVNGEYFIWIGRRNKNKQTFPGMLDNFTAGGLTAGLSIMECARKELKEEAGLSDDLLRQLKPVDTMSCAYEEEEGISFECQFTFDLKLPNHFTPKNVDGEVDEFLLMNIDQVKKAIISDGFKPNSAAVTLQFLFRKGLINPDKISCYAEIITKLHMPSY